MGSAPSGLNGGNVSDEASRSGGWVAARPHPVRRDSRHRVIAINRSLVRGLSYGHIDAQSPTDRKLLEKMVPEVGVEPKRT